MRRILFIISSFFTVLHALPNGNPAAPGMLQRGAFSSQDSSLSVGVEYDKDYVFNRHMHIDEFKINTDQGLALLSIFKRFDLYAGAGASSFSIENESQELNSFDNVSWQIGGRAIPYQWNRFSLGIDGKAFFAYPHFKNLSHAHMHYFEWQLGVGAAYQIEMLVPYIAAKYSYAKAHFFNTPLISTVLKNSRKFGLVLGSAITASRIFSINIETRLVDEQALSLSGRLQF